MPSKLVDMALTTQEQAESINKMPYAHGNAPKYPYGLCLCLNNETLEKLNVDRADWQIGDVFDLRCMAKVTSISENENDSGKDCRVEMQIVMMGAESETDEGEEDEAD